MCSLPDKVIIDGAAIQQLMNSPQGPVVKQLEFIGSAVQVGARARIRPSQVRTDGGLSLRDSIVKRLVTGTWPTMKIIAQKPYAYFVHEGTEPHEIRPRQKSVLRFYSQQAGGFVFARVVQHPGTKPLRYLTDTAREVFARLH
jgi:hypothetical protein